MSRVQLALRVADLEGRTGIELSQVCGDGTCCTQASGGA